MAALELALILPLLIGLMVGVAEIWRYVMLDARLDQAATLSADLATRNPTLDLAQVDDIFIALGQLIEPFSLGADGVVVLSGVGVVSGERPRVLWQRRGAGSGNAEAAASVGQTVDLPANVQLADGQVLVMAEVFYAYEPVSGKFLPQRTIVRRAFMRPRAGELHTLQQ